MCFGSVVEMLGSVNPVLSLGKGLLELRNVFIFDCLAALYKTPLKCFHNHYCCNHRHSSALDNCCSISRTKIRVVLTLGLWSFIKGIARAVY